MTTALETILLEDANSRVHLAPERGGMATRFTVSGRSVFYLDEATLLAPPANVRGGNPVLFPSPGKLSHDRFDRDGRSGAMGQHGFARNRAWEVAAREGNAVTLRLQSNDATRAVYPWDFALTYRYSLAGSTLRIEQRFEGDDMPFAAGFHPYFAVADKARARIETKATRAWDNVQKKIVPIPRPIDLAGSEVDLHLIDHDSDECVLDLGDGSRIRVRAKVPVWVVWAVPGKDYVCVEPWTAGGNALNTGEQLLVAKKGVPIDLVTEIAFEA